MITSSFTAAMECLVRMTAAMCLENCVTKNVPVIFFHQAVCLIGNNWIINNHVDVYFCVVLDLFRQTGIVFFFVRCQI